MLFLLNCTKYDLKQGFGAAVNLHCSSSGSGAFFYHALAPAPAPEPHYYHCSGSSSGSENYRRCLSISGVGIPRPAGRMWPARRF